MYNNLRRLCLNVDGTIHLSLILYCVRCNFVEYSKSEIHLESFQAIFEHKAGK